MMLGWLWSFSLLWLALTDTVRAGSRVHQTRPKGTQMRIISLDVEEAKIQKNMLSSSQSLSREEDSGKEDQTRSMSGPSKRREGLKRTWAKMLMSKPSVPRGEENNMEDRTHCLMRASRRKQSKMEERRRWLIKALSRINGPFLGHGSWSHGPWIMKRNAMFSK